MAVKAEKTFGFACEKCNGWQCHDYSLEASLHEGRPVMSDNIDCTECGHTNLVFEDLQAGAICGTSSALSEMLADRLDELKSLEAEEKGNGKKALDADRPLDAQHHAVMAKVYQAIKREAEFWHSLTSKQPEAG